MMNLAYKNDWASEAELSTLSEAVEQAAWRDAMQAAPAWVLTECGIAALEVGDALLLVSPGSSSLLFNRVIGRPMRRSPKSSTAIANSVRANFSSMPGRTQGRCGWGVSCSNMDCVRIGAAG
jgi:hypothetical protein